jgi:general secretion pathway protein K
MSVRDGFVLIAALWLVVALSAASLDMGLRGRARGLAVANALEGTRARAGAEAGIEHVRSRLAASLSGHADLSAADLLGLGPRADLEAWIGDTLVLGDVRYVIAVRNPGARVNINAADEEQMRSLLRALRIDYGTADRIAQAMADWRDADHEHRPRGAERDTYLRDRHPVLPRNGSFQAIEEIRWVRGMTSATYARLEPHITVHGNGLIDINTASEAVLESLPGLTPGAAAAILRLRRAGRPVRRIQELTDALPPLERQVLLSRTEALLRRITFDTRAIEVISVGWIDGSPVRATATALIGWSGTTVAVGWRTVT